MWQVTRAALRPLDHVAMVAEDIAAGDVDRRLKPSRADTELGRMAAAFDRMVDALQEALDRSRTSEAATRQFLADASHELRTPIARLQATAETLLREQPARPDGTRSRPGSPATPPASAGWSPTFWISPGSTARRPASPPTSTCAW